MTLNREIRRNPDHHPTLARGDPVDPGSLCYRRRMTGLPRLRLVLAVAGSMIVGACVLDLDNLASGGTGGMATTSSGSGTGGAVSSTDSTTTSSGAGGDAGCPLLDCSCVGGPTVVASGSPLADSPRGIALTSDGVFWVNDASGKVVQAPASGGPAQKLVDASLPRAIDAYGDTLVWTAQAGIYTCTLPSCATSAHEVLNGAAPGSLRDVAYDGNAVVWSDVGSGSNSGKVIACLLGSCSPVDLADGLLAPAGVTLHGGSAFWVDQGDGNQNGVVARSPVPGPAEMQVAASLNLPTQIAADDSYVYWTEWTLAGHVYRCPYPGSCNAPEDIAPAAGGLPHPRDIRVGGGRIYWTNTDDGSIRSCPQQGCASTMPKVHVTGRLSLQRLVVGTSCIFWTEDGDGGAVMKMPR